MRFSRKSLGIPYAVFLVIFVAAPLLFLFYYAFTNGQGQFTIQNFTHFFTDPNTLGTLYYSFSIALVTTWSACCWPIRQHIFWQPVICAHNLLF